MFFRAAKGFMLAISDVRDQPVIEQDGYYIAPGSATLLSLFYNYFDYVSNFTVTT
jgi:hypothetical protein